MSQDVAQIIQQWCITYWLTTVLLGTKIFTVFLVYQHWDKLVARNEKILSTVFLNIILMCGQQKVSLFETGKL